MAATIYERVFEDILLKINTGVLKPGSLLSSESRLAKEYTSTRTTIRKGLSLLTESGYIYSIPGKGYLVCEPNNNKHILNFNEMDLINEHSIRTQLLEVNIISPTKELMKQLQIEKTKKIVVIRRLFHSRKEPFAYDIKYLPFDKGNPIVEEVIQYATFPEIVARRASLFSIKNELKIWVKKAQGDEVKFLKVDEGHPLMVVEQRLFENENKPIGWGQIFYRGEYCHLHAISTL